jgi:octaprenyl-diphosphate synthase
MTADAYKKHFEPISEELSLVEGAISKVVDSRVQLLREIGDHLRSAGGKRLRPALLLLSARACSSSDWDEGLRSKLVAAACAVEAIHMAALVHDDVVDSAGERRGRLSVNSRWGNEKSVLAGDFILSSALAEMMRNTTPEVMQLVLDSTVGLCEGEMKQLDSKWSFDVDVQRYFEAIANKTSGLFAMACEVGVMLAGCPPVHRAAARRYGTHYGNAFQITDDLLDIVGDPQITGKPRGTDLKEGKYTLPVIYALKRAPGDLQDRLRGELLRFRDPEDESEVGRLVSSVTDIADSVGAIEESRTTAESEVASAVGALSDLPDSPARRSLIGLARSTLDRTF